MSKLAADLSIVTSVGLDLAKALLSLSKGMFFRFTPSMRAARWLSPRRCAAAMFCLSLHRCRPA